MTSDNHVTGPLSDEIDLLALQSLVDRLNSAGVTVAQTERGGWKLYDNEAALYELKQMAPDLARAILAMKAKEQASVHCPDEVELVVGALAANLDLSVDLLIKLQATGNLTETARAVIAALQHPAKGEGE